MKEFENRINLTQPLEVLSIEVCKKYNLGEFKTNELIEIGYEDFNYILTTTEGKFVVKVFSNERTTTDAQNLANRASIAYINGVTCPKIYTSHDKNLTIFNIEDIEFRVLVMEYINGKDYFSLNKIPTEKELSIIATELAKLNSIEYKPPFIYDKWAIVNYIEEYNKYARLVDKEDKPLIDKALDAFKSCDFSKLKYGFVHGDVIETNVIKDNLGKVYFIDFSVSNYLPRIVDLAVSIGDFCIDLDNIEISKEKTKRFLLAYERVSPLSQYEKECLKKFLICHQAITIIETMREKLLENNDSEENEVFLQKGKKGLRIVLGENFLNECIF